MGLKHVKLPFLLWPEQLICSSPEVSQPTDLNAQQQTVVHLLQLFLPHLDILCSVLLLLQLPDVVDGSFQDGAFVPAHLTAVIGKK